MTRAEFVAEARTWIGTPYVPRGTLKGIGCDCATLLYVCLRDAGIIVPQDVGVFSTDWWAHTTEESYRRWMLRHASQVAEGICTGSLKPDDGNIILCRTAGGRVYNHGAIITKWPLGVHAVKSPGVVEIDLTRDPMWIMKEVAIFDPFTKGGSE